MMVGSSRRVTTFGTPFLYHHDTIHRLFQKTCLSKKRRRMTKIRAAYLELALRRNLPFSDAR